ncbi:TPA: tryptophan--tRNA ligase [Methanosarcina acetivorans]|uniref:Tryptophan--tRNA ligase n=2 Tax=Methanosarcina acetivorans TaxID=2214 RepID=SYW_METAC|nr:tryptophan--tRNA ligase [Methanosarcina acetivorans]Q8TUA1.1 RecName: Full=Tryptophan--tRNA ligase; AltName: Full=Tryptophanyl-tRNA synthetase; Short=TrpRS [Methanosarcina acetivorans C2A]AAM03625.1 tryptophanyl-tRNA synthetase [Methanosarcina acetivorans C2A]HIH95308.1 tryptophan--tRNA ligase [Methanosarcina acetivorans]
MDTKLDPWSSSDITDYSKLFEEFGISPFENVLPEIPSPHMYMRRKVIFGHRDYEQIAEAMRTGAPFSVMDGFMPSGKVHLGHKMVMDQIVWHQEMGASAFVGIADREAFSVRGFSWQKCREIGVEEYILSLIALGFKPDGLIYFQSGCGSVKDLAFELGAKVNFSELSAIYGFSGETSLSHMLSVATQAADILQPQLEEFGGPKPVVVPVGPDQDPHLRLTRGLAGKMNMFRVEEREDVKTGRKYLSVRGKTAQKEALQELKKRIPGKVKLYEEHIDVLEYPDLAGLEKLVREVTVEFGGYAFIPPASTYHRFMSGLQGGKMSSSIPESQIALTDSPKEGAKKVKRAKTGGCVTLEEQKKLGGKPEECSVFELMLFHLIASDEELLEIKQECISGTRMCGSCKQLAAEKMQEFLKDHQEKRELAREHLDEYRIIYKD